MCESCNKLGQSPDGQVKRKFVSKGVVEKSMGALSAAEVRYIEAGIAQDLRSDGRSRTDYRSISIDTSVIPQVGFSPQLTCF